MIAHHVTGSITRGAQSLQLIIAKMNVLNIYRVSQKKRNPHVLATRAIILLLLFIFAVSSRVPLVHWLAL